MSLDTKQFTAAREAKNRAKEILKDVSQVTGIGITRVDLPWPHTRPPQPERIVGLIEHVSIGPYLELFGWSCSTRDDWRCCGAMEWKEFLMPDAECGIGGMKGR